VALRTVTHQFEGDSEPPKAAAEPSLRIAVSPLVFPTIVTPYGIAAVIICVALTPDDFTKAAIFGALLALMFLNLIAMLDARPVHKHLGMPMQLLGPVSGIIQVALGLQIIFTGLRGLGFHLQG
jgi:small neutral amino acid transporter SnatA (MarC family)